MPCTLQPRTAQSPVEGSRATNLIKSKLSEVSVACVAEGLVECFMGCDSRFNRLQKRVEPNRFERAEHFLWADFKSPLYQPPHQDRGPESLFVLLVQKS
mmetsp:Transcript_39900/g.78452  ORF Transcript_39900/g.78452 Transcript_39900/m.78452 type:complete len:99 (-) Transcript_39900:898-1194(-)